MLSVLEEPESPELFESLFSFEADFSPELDESLEPESFALRPPRP